MTKFMRTRLMAIAMLLGTGIFAQQALAQQAAAGAQAGGPCAPAAQGRGGRGQPAADLTRAPQTRKRVLAWEDTRNGIAQKDYVTHALAQLERLGYETGAFDLIIRTDSNIISFNPKMTDGTPASGGPSLCNIDAIVFAGHRNVPLDAAGQKDLITAIHDQGKGFVSLFIGILPDDTFPEMANILGAKAAAVDVHDPFGEGSTIINESPDSPFTGHLPKIWAMPNEAPYQPEHFNRDEIQVLLRKDVSKLAPVKNYARTDGDYPVAWTKMYGKGRVFFSSLGHNEADWDDSNLLRMYYQAILWSLGETQYGVKPHPLPADARPPQGRPAPAQANSARGSRGTPAE